MNRSWEDMLALLAPRFSALIGMPAVTYRTLPSNMPERGIYLFSEKGEPLYVGRTNRMRERLRGHCVPSGSHFTATFAFRIARKETNRTKASYAKSGSRADLLKDPAFAAAFGSAKRRVSEMELRFVEETDPTSQAILEIYLATVLGTPYNDFENH